MLGLTRLYLENVEQRQPDDLSGLMVLDLEPSQWRSRYRELRRRGWRLFHAVHL